MTPPSSVRSRAFGWTAATPTSSVASPTWSSSTSRQQSSSPLATPHLAATGEAPDPHGPRTGRCEGPPPAGCADTALLPEVKYTDACAEVAEDSERVGRFVNVLINIGAPDL